MGYCNNILPIYTADFSGQGTSLFLFVGHSEFKNVKKINYNYYCINEKPDLFPLEYVDEYFELVKGLASEFMSVAAKYGQLWTKGEIISKVESNIFLKPIVFFEGEHDISFVKRAASLLGKDELLNQIEIRQRGSCSNLDKLWNTLTQDNWETIPQIKILIYDCDTNRTDGDFGHIYRRTIPAITGNIIKRGIENLFPDETVNEALTHKREFVDFSKTQGTKRGVKYIEEQNVINKHEKKNFCNWVCENGTPESFQNFQIVFTMIEDILTAANFRIQSGHNS